MDTIPAWIQHTHDEVNVADQNYNCILYAI